MHTSEEDYDKNNTNFSEAVKQLNKFLTSFDISRFKTEDFVYKIEKDDVNKLVSFFDSCEIPNNYLSYKDILREKFINKFKLLQNDTIIFLENVIYIKIFKQIKTQNTDEKRACGLDIEALEKYKNKYFENDLHNELVLSALPYVVEDLLSFRKLNPQEFKKIFVPILVNLVEIIVIEHTELSDIRKIRGMSYHLLRELFDEIMFFIAEDILFNFSNKDKQAEEFLSLFSVHVVIDSNGIRHKPNPILDESNNAWNMTTINSIIIQHKKAKQAMYDKKNALVAIKKKLSVYKTEHLQLTNIKELEEIKIIDIDKKLENTKKTLDKLQNITADSVKFLDDGVEKIYGRKPLIAQMFKKEDNLLSEKSTIITNIEKIKINISLKLKDINIWKKKYNDGKDMIASIEKSNHPIDKLYDSIKNALAKTLAKR